MYNIKYKNGSNEIEIFEDLKHFGRWWRMGVMLGNRRRGSVASIEVITEIKQTT